jgi:hypothetical protein
MAFSNWRDAARILRQRLEPADEEPRALAKSLGLELSEGVPARVAAALLERRLAAPLRKSPDLPVTDSQEEFLDDLVRDLRLDQRPKAGDPGARSKP